MRTKLRNEKCGAEMGGVDVKGHLDHDTDGLDEMSALL